MQLLSLFKRHSRLTSNRILEPKQIATDMQPAPLLITNDDGVQSQGLLELARALHSRGHPIAVLAPLSEQSACGMKLTLSSDMAFKEHEDIAEEIREHDSIPLRIFSLDGTPCDCVIVAIDGGLRSWAPEIEPWICISGINRGPNLSVDVLHSGTVSAAREASLYGMPSISVSLATYSHEDYSQSVKATAEVMERLSKIIRSPPENLLRPNGSKSPSPRGTTPESIRSWMLDGNIFLNINIPEKWNESFQTVPLGARWYHNATDMQEKSQIGVAFEVGAARIVDEDIPMTDCNSINSGFSSITPLASWPRNHPLGVPESILQASMESDNNGFPVWLSSHP